MLQMEHGPSASDVRIPQIMAEHSVYRRGIVLVHLCTQPITEYRGDYAIDQVSALDTDLCAVYEYKDA